MGQHISGAWEGAADGWQGIHQRIDERHTCLVHVETRWLGINQTSMMYSGQRSVKQPSMMHTRPRSIEQPSMMYTRRLEIYHTSIIQTRQRGDVSDQRDVHKSSWGIYPNSVTHTGRMGMQHTSMMSSRRMGMQQTSAQPTCTPGCLQSRPAHTNSYLRAA